MGTKQEPKIKRSWDLEVDLEEIRREFPILKRCTYLISNSLGAVPRGVKDSLGRYYSLWEQDGVSAWSREWWDLARTVGDKVAELIGAGPNEVTMLTHATQAHWVALSTAFGERSGGRTKIIMTDLDFPSTIYAVTRIAEAMGWEIDKIDTGGVPDIPWQRIAERIDAQTLCVAVSHVCYRSAYIQEIARISEYARRFGAFTLIDGYHAPGTVPVDVKQADVDFYVGGCLKWLCGGPGNAFLYVRPAYATHNPPQLTGWLAHRSPFLFEPLMDYAEGAHRQMSGTPPIPALYCASPGLDLIREIGISAIRRKSLHQTGQIIRLADERGYRVFTPRTEGSRGGAVSLGIPHAFPVKQALEHRNFKLDFRKGGDEEPDVIRVGPHFYTQDQEILNFFEALDDIYTTHEYKKYPDMISHVT
jgi:kynureninase